MIAPMRFLHTSDWQLGMTSRQLGAQAGRARERRFETAARVMELAREEGVDFVLVAGDIFDSPEVDTVAVDRALEILESAACRVFVLPGNHDPLGPGSVWERRAWSRHSPNLVLLDEARETDLGAASALYGCPLSQKRSRRDPTAWIPPRGPDDRRIRIGIAHGSLGVVPKTANFPIAQNRCETAGLDYLALGDWHGRLELGRAAYSGTPEQTSFSEKDAGYVLLVEIDPDSHQLTVDSRRVGELEWSDLQPRVRHESDVEALRSELESLSEPERVVLRVRAAVEVGAAPELEEDLHVLAARLEGRLFHCDWKTERQGLWEDELPAGLARDLDEELASIASSESAVIDGELDPGVATATEARSLLRVLVAEAVDGAADSP